MTEETVTEMLQELPIGLTRAGFYDLCQDKDRPSVDEAWRRYSSQGLAARRPSPARLVRTVRP
ncbi:hypothetical protein [Devosia ginsengisoli]|uniref:hypothetical protein n=1 Tax=Devosia ginsengisoli TaxID=400770 RepID=UPI0026F0CA11|nr:hypothetical protein [Devosia ginsengisoli]MCR6673252.1 hypothetical protein [Devosia ginsengisoli]